MATEHDPTTRLDAEGPSKLAPLEVRVEDDGTGSASFEWPAVLDALIRGLGHRVRGALGREIAVIGVRFIDGDGRAVAGPVPDGLALVGFTTSR